MCKGFWRVVDKNGEVHEFREHPDGVTIHRYDQKYLYVIVFERGNMLDQRLKFNISHIYLPEHIEIETSLECKSSYKTTLKLAPID